MKIRAVKSKVIHEMLTDHTTHCGRTLAQFTHGVVPVSDEEPVTCAHCRGEVKYFGHKKWGY